MPAPANLVHQTSTTTGTGNFTLAAVNGKQSFANAFSTGSTTNVFDYFISNNGATEYERGTGHMSDATTLVRDTVIESTNSNNAVDFSAGTKDVTNDVPAAKQVTTDTTQTLTNKTLTDPLVGTQTAGDNSTKAASTAYVYNAVREKLSAARTYYVRTDGNDSNTGLADTSGGAFLTLQKAWNTITANLDLSGYTVTIQVADGTYTAGIASSTPWVGGGGVTVAGNSGTPSNVIISVTSGQCFNMAATNPGAFLIKDLKMSTTTSGNCILGSGPNIIQYNNIDFGACAGYHVTNTFRGCKIVATGAYTVSGGAVAHWQTEAGSVHCDGKTVTTSGTPAFSTAWAYALNTGVISAQSDTFSGTGATGPRYSVASNGVILVNGGGATYLPGNVAGASTTGGQYL